MDDCPHSSEQVKKDLWRTFAKYRLDDQNRIRERVNSPQADENNNSYGRERIQTRGLRGGYRGRAATPTGTKAGTTTTSLPTAIGAAEEAEELEAAEEAAEATLTKITAEGGIAG